MTAGTKRSSITRLPRSAEGHVADYLATLSSPRTAKEYGRILNRFVAFVKDPQAVTPTEVNAFVRGPGPSGAEPSGVTINARISAVRGWYRWMQRMGLAGANPADAVTRPPSTPARVRDLTVDEIRALLAVIPDTDAGQRDRAIILTALLTGLRRSELMSLRAGDLTRNGKVYYTARIKGGDEVRRELPAPAVAAILGALERAGRPLDTLGAEERLWNVSDHGLYMNLQRYARNAGIIHQERCRAAEKRVAPHPKGCNANEWTLPVHQFRHLAAKLRRQSGANLEDVQRLLNHKLVSTTARYLTRREGQEDPGWAGAAAILGL